MSIARNQKDILKMFYGEIPGKIKKSLPRPLKPLVEIEIEDEFFISTKKNKWLHVWKMVVSDKNPNNKDSFEFAKSIKESFTDLIKRELKELKNMKVNLEVKVKFKKEEEEEQTQYMEQYFRENEPQLFYAHDDEKKIEEYFDNIFEIINGKIEAWVAEGSGWEVEKIELVYVNVARFKPLRGAIYLPIPTKLQDKKAIINVQNKDNECLKWAVRSALLPPPEGKNPNRPSSYSVNDGINWSGIDFPTPVKQIDKLEAQNENLAINMFGWENDCAIVYRISEKEKSLPRIELMLIESGEKQHYCYVKRVSALLYDQSKSHNKKHYCMLCMNGFSREDLLVDHEKDCNGLKGKPTRIDMPKEEEKIVSFQNYNKQMKVPYVIYADFEALVKKISLCELEGGNKEKSYTMKTEYHKASGYSYTVVRSDGEVSGPKVYRGENAVGTFLSDILQEEVKIRESLAAPKPIVMTAEDWKKYKNATDCHICSKSLIKDEFLDSLPVWSIEDGEGGEQCSYKGQRHKKCFYRAQKEQQWGILKLKKLTETKDQLEAKKQKNCIFCDNPFRKTSETQ